MPKSVKETREAAAKAARDEAEGKSRILEVTIGDRTLRTEVPRRIKRFKFLRAAAREDVAGMLDAIWPPDEDGNPHPFVQDLDELDLTRDEEMAFWRALVDVIGIGDEKN